MLQKYYPILSEINSPLSALVALEFSAAAAEIVINNDISNEVLESLLRNAVKETTVYHKEVEVAASALEAARRAAAKQIRTLRYRAAMAARKARATSKVSRRVKAVKKTLTKASLKGLKGLNIDVCRQCAVNAQTAVRSTVTSYNAALEAVELAVNKGGDARAIRAKVAALKEAVRLLEVRQLELRFAREMVSISLARHSA